MSSYAVGAARRSTCSTSSPNRRAPTAGFGAGLRLAELQQLFDDHPKVTDLGDQEVDRRLEPLRELLVPPFEYVGGRSQRGEWRTQLVAHVGDEPGVAVDAGLERVAIVVERRRRPSRGPGRLAASGERRGRPPRSSRARGPISRTGRRHAARPRSPTQLAAKVVTIDVPIEDVAEYVERRAELDQRCDLEVRGMHAR